MLLGTSSRVDIYACLTSDNKYVSSRTNRDIENADYGLLAYIFNNNGDSIFFVNRIDTVISMYC